MTVTIDFDISHEDPDRDQFVRDVIAKHNATLVYYQRSGPGGGNPQYGVECLSHSDAQSILANVYGKPAYDWEHHIRPNGLFSFHKPRT